MDSRMQTNHLAYDHTSVAQQSTRSMHRKRNFCSLAFWWIIFNFRELDSLDTSNSVVPATVVDDNQLRIPQGKKNNLEALRVLSGVAHRAYSGEIVCTWHCHEWRPRAPSFDRSSFSVAGLTLSGDHGFQPLSVKTCSPLKGYHLHVFARSKKVRGW